MMISIQRNYLTFSKKNGIYWGYITQNITYVANKNRKRSDIKSSFSTPKRRKSSQIHSSWLSGFMGVPFGAISVRNWTFHSFKYAFSRSVLSTKKNLHKKLLFFLLWSKMWSILIAQYIFLVVYNSSNHLSYHLATSFWW